jgi:hypothetical protein
VQHDFFSATPGPMLDFIPAPATQGIIRSAGLICRADTNRMILCYDDEKEDILRFCIPDDTGRLDFLFNVYALDPRYELYTDMRVSPSDAVPCYSTLESSFAVENGLQLKAASGTAVKKISERATPDENNRQPVKRPVFRVLVSRAEQDTLEHQEYFIRCKARATCWKYYLLGELAEQEMEIIDLRGEVQFQCAGRQTPFPDRHATVFYSAEPILLEERSDRRFQLRRQGGHGNKVLIKRLPNASVKNLSKEIIRGDEVYVSEIYINY